MKIAVLGTGMVGQAIASKLAGLGHEVFMGSRSRDNAKGLEWVKSAGERAHLGTFEDAARESELVFNCTSGKGAVEALAAAGETNLAGKIVVDIANPLDFSKGMPPTLFVSNDDSLGEQLQRKFPKAKIVKTLNTVNCEIMVNPGKLAGDHDMFVCGNDVGAKSEVTKILEEWFGWKHIVDLGDISQARGTESYLHLWVRLFGKLQTPYFNIHIVRA